jgi:GT2 family glycosyltransferase
MTHEKITIDEGGRPTRRARVSVVMPTRGRATALHANFGNLLAVRGIDQIIVVLDGSDAASEHVLTQARDPRVELLVNTAPVGAPAARNLGVARAVGDWILMAEDDCRFPDDYVEVLRAEATRLNADVIGAPWIFAVGQSLESALSHARSTPVERVFLNSRPSVFPRRGEIETPFMPNLALATREVMRAVPYDSGYRGNAWREETDFFVRVMKHGFRCYLTGATYAYQTDRWTGGNQFGRVRYEAWVLRNDVRFFRRHGAWLKSRGLVEHPGRVILSNSIRRVRASVRGTISRRTRVIRSLCGLGSA